MIYFPTKITKIILIILFAILTFHVCFLSSKSISVNYKTLAVSNISEIQYEIYLSSINRLDDKAACIKNTKTEYLFKLPYKTVYLFYWSYFSIATLLILLSKLKLNESENEK